mgnify:CR=1 FL=1
MISADFPLPEEIKIDDLLDTLRNLSWGAADILMAYARGEQPPYGFDKGLSVHNSIDGPVSAADLAVNSWLLDGLIAEFPTIEWDILSEESVKDKKLKNLENLTNNPGDDWNPRFYPDNQKIVFQSTRDGNWEIYMMNLQGYGHTILTNHPSTDYSFVFLPLTNP